MIAARIREYEEALLDPAVRRESARVLALLADNFLEIGASGKTWNREQIVDQLATEEYIQPTMDDFECSMITDSVVLATYKTIRTRPSDRHSRSFSAKLSLDKGFWQMVVALPSGNASNLKTAKAEGRLNFAASEEVVFFAARTVRALETAHQQNRYTQSHQDGQHSRIRSEPMNHGMHKPLFHHNFKSSRSKPLLHG